MLARKPGPAAAAALALSSNHRIGDVAQSDSIHQFVHDHVAEDEMVRIMLGMLDDEMPSDAVLQLARAIATWGTARPYRAVITLAGMTGHHWRTLRFKMITHGIADPMVLPSLHALLDFTEGVVLESMSTGNENKDQAARSSFFDKLYVPDAPAADPDQMPKPSGFSPHEVEASFDAFVAATGAARTP